MSQTTALTIGTLQGQPASVSASGGSLGVQVKATDAQGFASGTNVQLVSSNTQIAKVTTPVVDGNAPAGVVGVAPGSATITATALDNTNITATLNVTVTA